MTQQTPLQKMYEGGKCPECGTPISAELEDGDSCPVCEQELWVEDFSFDPQPL